MEGRAQRRVDKVLERIAREPLKGAWLATAVITVIVTIAAGLLMRVTDGSTFPTFGRGLWWAVQTTTTVGYGDVLPASVAGRLIAALVMVVGVGFITVSTAAIASAFVQASRRRREHGEDPEEAAAQLGRIEELVRAHTGAIDALQARLDELADELRRSRGGGGDDGPQGEGR